MTQPLHFLSLELRLLLSIWNGRLRSQIPGLQSTIGTLRGSPEEPGDWTKPCSKAVEPIAFEHLIGQLLEAMNYQNVAVTAPSNDKGVDVVADIELGITSVREVVQAKRQKSSVQRTVLDALRGSLDRFQAVRGTIITTAGFSKDAMQAAFEAGAPPITLIDGSKLMDLLIEYGIGVRTRSIEVLELDADAFAQTEEGEDS